MPNKTFYNLDIEKRNRIIDSAKLEFSRVELSEISIKNIVEDANIARGSFYQYFEDKEDLIRYIVKSEFETEKNNMKNFLEKASGDIFEAIISYYEYLVETRKKTDGLYYKHIFHYINTVEISELKQFKGKYIIKYVDLQRLNANWDEEIEIIINSLMGLTKMMLINVISGKISKKEGIRKHRLQINLLKNGMLRKESDNERNF